MGVFSNHLNSCRGVGCCSVVCCGGGSWIGLVGRRFRLLRWCKNRVQRRAFHPWHEFDQAGIADVEYQSVDVLVTKVAMSHLPALEAQRGFHLVALAKKADSLVLLRLVVVLVDRDRELDLFDGDDLLLLARRPFALVLLIQILAVVLNLADRRNGVGRDLNQVERALPGHLQCFKRCHDAKLLAVFIDYADLAGADTFIGADKRLRGTFINWWNKSPPQRVFSPAMRCLGFRCSFQKRM